MAVGNVYLVDFDTGYVLLSEDGEVAISEDCCCGEIGNVCSPCGVPLTEYLAVTFALNGDCPGVNDLTVILVQNPIDSNVWDLFGNTGGSLGCEQVTFGKFDCETGQLIISWGADNTATGLPTLIDCDPVMVITYNLIADFITDETCCSGVNMTAYLSTMAPP